MRKIATIVLGLALLGPLPAWAVGGMESARQTRDEALAEARALATRLGSLEERYRRVEDQASQAAAGLVAAYEEDLLVRGELARARALLGERADAAYRAGPGAFLEVLLGAESMADLAMAHDAIESAYVSDMEHVADVLDERSSQREATRRLQRDQAILVARQREMQDLQWQIESALAAAQELAEQAGVRLEELERQERRLQQAETRLANFQTIDWTYGADQSKLLAMLGADGGRGCDIPSGLRQTGRTFSGESSWYGWDFAGQHTANGAIYDPRLFTAAHKTLPLPTFLHVKRGNRCATVLVNDRGPYVDGRVLDLSQAAAEYLGVGVTMVHAEILTPAR